MYSSQLGRATLRLPAGARFLAVMAQTSCGHRMWHASAGSVPTASYNFSRGCCFTHWLHHAAPSPWSTQEHTRTTNCAAATAVTATAQGCYMGMPCRHASTVTSMRKLRKQFRHLNPSQMAAALANPDLDTGGIPHAEADKFEDGEEDESLLEQPDPFAPASAQLAKARRRRLGVLQSVPVVAPASEHLASALKRASKVTHSTTLKNEAEKERNRAARQMDTLMKELSVPLGKYVSSFPNPDKLHPFDAALLQLTVSTVTYRSVLGKVDALRKSLQTLGKSYANRASNAPNKQGALAVAVEGIESMESVYRNGSRAVEDLKDIAKKLRTLPVLELGLPTLALVGAPNVGKSSLVQVLSSGLPEVCNYPFTTRSIKMGHFFLDGRKHQVTDTPGLLARPDTERNKMEMLTLAALEYLPTSVLFVMDLTEECGTSVQDQWEIREEVRARFPAKQWIDVFSKEDMLTHVFQQADTRAGPPDTPPDLPQAATRGAANLASAGLEVEQPPLQPEQLAAAGEGEGKGSLTPAELAARLPGALRVSSITKHGINRLQGSIVRMFQKQQAEAAAAAAVAAETAAAADDNSAT